MPAAETRRQGGGARRLPMPTGRAALSALPRRTIMAAIDVLIDELDRRDGDTDLEPDADGEDDPDAE